MLYFSYGSNMSIRRLTERTPSAGFVAVARLPGHELKFHKIGRDGSGKCDAAMTGDDDNMVIGVVFDFPASEKPILDRYEGLGAGYQEKSVIVVPQTGKALEAVTYYATRIDPLLHPFHWYKQHVVTGATENSLPEHYVARIAAVESIADPMAGRHAEELKIY